MGPGVVAKLQYIPVRDLTLDHQEFATPGVVSPQFHLVKALMGAENFRQNGPYDVVGPLA